jgi:hypothetical protein
MRAHFVKLKSTNAPQILVQMEVLVSTKSMGFRANVSLVTLVLFVKPTSMNALPFLVKTMACA